MTPKFAVDVEVALQGTKVDVGEAVHCDGCDATFHEGAPVTIVARTRGDGWDIETVYGPHCAPTELQADRRDGEGVALAEAELAIVLSAQQAWLIVTRVDVLAWLSPASE